MKQSVDDDLLHRLASSLPQHSSGVRVALSGGLDSSVLLHALAMLKTPSLRACHVHHGLQPAAEQWAQHCEHFAGSLNVAFELHRVTIDPDDPTGPEAAARTARYAALRRTMQDGELLSTAHHRDDQAETVLLRLLRGSGLRGLSAIQRLTPFAPGQLWRPLLDVPRAVIARYAQQHRLEWIEDPHNVDPGYARSWLRQQMLPQLRERYPQLDMRLAQAAEHAAESVELLEALAEIDLADPAHAVGATGTLAVSAVLALTAARRRNLLRHWISRQGFAVPSSAMIERIVSEVLMAGVDTEPRVHWAGCELRRYRDALYAMSPLPELPSADWSCAWSSGLTLQLPPGCGQLIANRDPPLPLKVRPVRAGERWRPVPTRPSRSFKNLFQAAGTPPWTRRRMPLIECADEPVLVPGLNLATPVGQHWLSAGWKVRWHPASQFSAR